MKNKKKNKEPEVRMLNAQELMEEEKKYQACKKPIQIGWAIYAFAATLYLCTGLFTSAAVKNIPEKKPITESLAEYRECEEYNVFLAEVQRDATDKLIAGEITADEYQHIIETTSSDKKFEEFLRSLEDDKRVQSVISEYDDYKDAMNSIGQKHSILSLTSLSSLLVATLILAKYRFREMDIEEARKKRDEAGLNSPFEEFRQ